MDLNHWILKPITDKKNALLVLVVNQISKWVFQMADLDPQKYAHRACRTFVQYTGHVECLFSINAFWDLIRTCVFFFKRRSNLVRGEKMISWIKTLNKWPFLNSQLPFQVFENIFKGLVWTFQSYNNNFDCALKWWNEISSQKFYASGKNTCLSKKPAYINNIANGMGLFNKNSTSYVNKERELMWQDIYIYASRANFPSDADQEQ